MIIAIEDYWIGPNPFPGRPPEQRDVKYAASLTPEIVAAAAVWVERENKLLARAAEFGIALHKYDPTGTLLTSGWRPPLVNAKTKGAATNSKHMTGQAGDVYDPDGNLDDWLMSPIGQQALHDLGLWMEHPSATKGWSHTQTIPPHSGNRVFYP